MSDTVPENPPEDSPAVITPISFLTRALNAVPAVRYALGIGGIIAVIAIAFSFGISAKVALFGTMIMLILMVVLVIFAALAAEPTSAFRIPAIVFTWFGLLLFMATSILLLTSVFWASPLNLRSLLGIPDPSQKNAGPTPADPTSHTAPNQTPPTQATPTEPAQTPTGTRPGGSPSGASRSAQNKKTAHEQTTNQSIDHEAQVWELRGDRAMQAAIQLETKLANNAATNGSFSPMNYEAIIAGFSQARSAWKNAYNVALNTGYKKNLVDKINARGGFTCENPESERLFCYSNESEYDVLEYPVPQTAKHAEVIAGGAAARPFSPK
jgi:hypothetical protein